MSIYACSDLHGNLTLWNNIKEFLKPGDKLFYLGEYIFAVFHCQISFASSSTVSSKIFIASRTVSGLVRSTPAILSSSSG